jgi:Protein of unknown function
VIDPLEAGVGAVVGGAAGALAHSGQSYYHDALRPLARDLRSGSMDRTEAARYGWGVSYRFIAWFALPFSMLTGTVISHLVFLPADVVGLRSRQSWVAIAVAALIGGAVFAAIDAIPQLLDDLQIDLTDGVSTLTDPVRWLYPTIPLVAAFKLARSALGAGMVLVFGGAAASIFALAGREGDAGAVGGLVGLVALFAFHLFRASREGVPEAPQVVATDTHVRAALPVLLVVGAGVAFLAEAHRIAGEPMSALLIAQDHQLDAAAVALITFAAFFPLVAVSSVTADSYSTQGTPDWIPAAGYVSPNPVTALIAGPILMASEVLTARHSIQLVLRLPILSESAAAVREAMGDVMLVALLFGGLLAANQLAGPVGFFAVGSAWLANENFGRPVMRFAVAPVGAIIVGLAANVWEVIT